MNTSAGVVSSFVAKYYASTRSNSVLRVGTSMATAATMATTTAVTMHRNTFAAVLYDDSAIADRNERPDDGSSSSCVSMVGGRRRRRPDCADPAVRVGSLLPLETAGLPCAAASGCSATQ